MMMRAPLMLIAALSMTAACSKPPAAPAQTAQQTTQTAAQTAGQTIGQTTGQTTGQTIASPPEQGDALARAEAFYTSRPVYERPHHTTKKPSALADMSAQTCGGCHKAIYEEWRLSTHSQAWLGDAQFQEELKKSRGPADPKQRSDVGWLCVNCHTPLTSQIERLVVGLEGGDISKPVYTKNPTFDRALQQDAITCATCHVFDGVIHGPYGSDKAPHAVKRDPSLQSEQVCLRCHQAEARYPKQNLGCFFDTGAQWAASKYGQPGAERTPCQGCHMPEVTRKVAEAFDVPERKTRRHWFGGSLIPKHPKHAEALAALRPVYGSGVTLSIHVATPEDLKALATQPAPDWPADLKPSPSRCAPGEPCTRLIVRTTNDRAGHHFPTGDPERHALIDVTVVSDAADSATLASARDLIGSRFKWWPAIELLSDTRIPAGAHRDLLVEIPAVPHAAIPLRLDLRADKYRMDADAFEHHHLAGRYVRGRTFHRSSWLIKPNGKIEAVRVVDDLRPDPAPR